MGLSKRMMEAIQLLKQEEFYLWDTPTWSAWRAYNLPEQTIRTDTMKALENRGIVKVMWNTSGRGDRLAKLLYPDMIYEEDITASQYCISCVQSYQCNNTGRWYCRKTRQIVVGTDERATVNAMKCH